MKSPLSADVPAYDREMASPLLAHTANQSQGGVHKAASDLPERLDFRDTKTHRR